ncbi:MAG TPA: hypothetical protein VMV58_01940 [Desulfosporosinus sp.]|nr:hypothetical protein [Desulfosporosinus sp.]
MGESNPRYLAGVKAKRINEVDIRSSRDVSDPQTRALKTWGFLNQVKIPRLIRDPQLIQTLE